MILLLLALALERRSGGEMGAGRRLVRAAGVRRVRGWEGQPWRWGARRTAWRGVRQWVLAPDVGRALSLAQRGGVAVGGRGGVLAAASRPTMMTMVMDLTTRKTVAPRGAR